MTKPLKIVGIALLAALALAAAFVITAGGPNDLAAQALEAYQAGDLTTARLGYEQALALDPEHTASVIGLAEVAIDERDPDRIREYGERAIARAEDPQQRARLRLALARTRVDDGEFAEALALASLALDDDPSLATTVQGVQGLAKLGEGQHDDARALLEQAAEGGATDSRVYSALTQLQLLAGQPEAARASAERAVELAPGDPALWVIVADLRDRAGDRAGAEQALGQALELEADNALARATLARFQLESGRGEDALAAARQAHASAPDDPLARRTLARALLAAGQADEALGLFEAAAALHWEDRLVYGQALCAAGQGDEGLKALQEAAATRPDDERVQLEAGGIALDAGQPASGFFRQALELGGSYAARVGLARALAAEDRAANHAAILDQLTAACDQAPERAEAVAALAEHYVAVGALDQARTLLSSASAKDPALAFWQGRLALAGEDWDAAVEAFEACAQAAPDYPGLGEWLQRARDRRP